MKVHTNLGAIKMHKNDPFKMATQNTRFSVHSGENESIKISPLRCISPTSLTKNKTKKTKPITGSERGEREYITYISSPVYLPDI